MSQMTSLLKTMAKFGPPRNQTNYISLEGDDESFPKMYFFIEIE